MDHNGKMENVSVSTAEERKAEKKRIRLAALAGRDRLTVMQRKNYSAEIVKRVAALADYRDADALLVYVSFRSEVDTFPLIEQAFSDGKAVFVPKVMEKEMAFYRIFSLADLSSGYRGILEPLGGCSYDEWRVDLESQSSGCPQENLLKVGGTQECGSAALSAIICMPGVAFDRARHRIGYGGGFYDRFLSKMAETRAKAAGKAQLQIKLTTAALAFGCQIFETIPWEAHDICPERIITETEII